MTPVATRQGVVLLGSTGSIGASTLDVLARHADRFYVAALTAHRQVDTIFEQCKLFRPKLVAMLDETAAGELSDRLRAAQLSIEVCTGVPGLERAASMDNASIVVAAIVGAAGLLPTLAAVRAGKRVLFANKEALVIGGRLLIEEARRSKAQLLPVDSEHNAIFQCLPLGFTAGTSAPGIRRILLTCSGGPFREWPADRLTDVTPDQACAHPKWAMGPKISVDSATLMNKGLELIEACRLFGVGPDKVEVVIHPQSVIHSMVEYVDGSVLAQLANPDMRIPIANALAWPDRISSGASPVDFYTLGRLEFSAPDIDRFPCLRLAYEAARAGNTAPAILNAANEIAVAAFLEGRIPFTDIARVVEQVLKTTAYHPDDSLEHVLTDDANARTAAACVVDAFAPMPKRSIR
jgi:1-deoxy-D-xylulose-5-phosphate reductoisomerase